MNIFYVWVKTGMEVSHSLKLYSYIMSVLLLNASPPSLERIDLSQTPTKSVETDARPSLVHHPIMRRDEANAWDHAPSGTAEIRDQRSEIRDRAKEGRCKIASQEVLCGLTAPVMISPAACLDDVDGPPIEQ